MEKYYPNLNYDYENVVKNKKPLFPNKKLFYSKIALLNYYSVAY